MPQYVAKFSLLNGKTMIHAASCPQAKAIRSQFTSWNIQAKSAALAAALADSQEELVRRGYPFPKLCPCTKTEGR